MPDIVKMQTINCSDLDPGRLCSFDLEVIDGKTTPLIHQAARFLFINGGRGVIRIQSRDYALGPGAFIAILPWQITDIVEVSAPLQYYIVVYRFDVINQIIKSFYNTDNREIDLIKRLSDCPAVTCNDSQYDRVSSIFLAIRDEVGIESTMTRPEPWSMGGIYTTNLLVELIVQYVRVAEGFPVSAERLRSDPSGILPYLYHHLGEKLTLAGLSNIFYMSEYAISQYITGTTGLSFFDLLGEMRVGKTVSFLLYTDLTLEELAEILGYVDAAHISKVFAARMGIKAGEYRKTYQRIGDICKVKESKKAYAIVDYLYRCYREPLTPQSVSARFGIGVPELQKTLLYQVERNFEEFLGYIRVNRASELLLQTDRSIVDIAYEVGFQSPKTFSRYFLKLRVMTPGSYRKQVKLQQNSLEG